MYAIYLRKSRADIEAEKRGEGETLSRHKRTLLKLAGNAEIGRIYTEIVSGESLAVRPEMQKLLADVEEKRWAGVYVMEIERLCRGNSIDQGIVAQAFKASGTKIITPQKTYDPENEFDEEYFEFSLFMSRREYKTINRRMAAGKRAAALEGKFIGSKAPYGYEKIRTREGATLAFSKTEAAVLQNIFDWYVNSGMGVCRIANRLNALMIPPRSGGRWAASSVRGILENPVYTGRIRTGGKTVEGMHMRLVSDEIFNAAQSKRKSVPISGKRRLSNPLAGIMECGGCGKKLLRRESKSRGRASLLCPYTHCKNVGSYFDAVENAVISALSDFYKELVLEKRRDDSGEKMLALIKREQAGAKVMQKRLYSFLERGIYSEEEYIKRRNALNEKMQALNASRERLCRAAENTDIEMPKGFSSYYNGLKNAEQRNAFLRCFAERCVYTKIEKGEKFELDIFVRTL